MIVKYLYFILYLYRIYIYRIVYIYIQNSDLNHVFFDDVINFMRFFIFLYLLFQGFTGKRTLEIHIFFYMFNISYIT